MYIICVSSQNDLCFPVFFINKYILFKNLLCGYGVREFLMVTLDFVDYVDSVVIAAGKIIS